MLLRAQHIFLLILLCFSLGIQAQSSRVPQVTVSYANDSINTLVRDIEAQTSLRFYYNLKELDSIRFNGQFSNEPVSTVLDKLFANSGYYYLLDGDRILLTKGERLVAGLPEGLTEPGKAISIQENNSVDLASRGKRKAPVAVLENKVYEIGSKANQSKAG